MADTAPLYPEVETRKKHCVECGCEFVRAKGKDNRSWAAQKFCGIKCARKGTWKLHDCTDAEYLAARCERKPNGCLEWTGARNDEGYGLAVRRAKNVLAHRLAYQTHKGDPGGLLVCHQCDNPCCIDPGHLFLGTNRDNSDDKRRKDRQPRGEQKSNAALTEEAVRVIRKSTLGHQALADRFGVSKQSVRHARAGRTWKHVQ